MLRPSDFDALAEFDERPLDPHAMEGITEFEELLDRSARQDRPCRIPLLSSLLYISRKISAGVASDPRIIHLGHMPALREDED